MSIKHIKTGDRVIISSPQSGYLDGNIYSTHVEEVKDKNIVQILAPIALNQIVNLPTKCILEFLFITQSARYRFDGVVEGRTREGNFNFVNIKLVSAGVKIQERSFFRFVYTMDFKFTLFNPENGENKSESPENESESATSEPQNGIILDISGGGIRFVSNFEMPEGAQVRAVLLLNDEYIVAVGKVIEQGSNSSETYKYLYRLQFMYMTSSDQEKIVQFISKEQRKVSNRTR